MKDLQFLIKEGIDSPVLTRQEIGILKQIANESFAIHHIAQYAQRSQNSEIFIKKLSQMRDRLENMRTAYVFLKEKLEGKIKQENNYLKLYIKKTLNETVTMDSPIHMVFGELIHYAGEINNLNVRAGEFFSENPAPMEQKRFLIKYAKSIRAIKRQLVSALHEAEHFAVIEAKKIKTGKIVHLKDFK